MRDFQLPAFNDLIIYELHIGTFFAVDQMNRDRRATRGGQYLDVLDRVEHLRDLGVNAIELLPIHEFASEISRGYDGIDLFSPEMDYGETEPRSWLTISPRSTDSSATAAHGSFSLLKSGRPSIS